VSTPGSKDAPYYIVAPRRGEMSKLMRTTGELTNDVAFCRLTIILLVSRMRNWQFMGG